MIKTSINTGSFGSGSKPGIQNLLDLERLFEEAPEKIELWNDLAAKQTVDRVQHNLAARWEPSQRFISVTSKRYGRFGMQILISVAPGIQIMNTTQGRRYNPLIAARIFLNTESGYVGRRGFKLRLGGAKGGLYIVSHSSGKWMAGDRLTGATVPQMGAFYYSGKTGVEKIPIKKYASQTMVNNLNVKYKTLLNRSGRR